MKYYISGPITGKQDGNRAEFAKAAKLLKAAGFHYLNPFDLDLIHPLPAPETKYDKNYYAFMRRDLKYLLDCDAVLALKDWEISKGARMEIELAYAMDMPIHRFTEAGKIIEAHIVVDVDFDSLVPSSLWK